MYVRPRAVKERERKRERERERERGGGGAGKGKPANFSNGFTEIWQVPLTCLLLISPLFNLIHSIFKEENSARKHTEENEKKTQIDISLHLHTNEQSSSWFALITDCTDLCRKSV